MSLSSRSKLHIWHPFTQMKIADNPIPIVKGEGVYLYEENGKKYIDAISSWWTCIHGHAHPYIAKKIYEQATELEHVIFAGFTHEPAVRLTERLMQYLPSNQKKAFFSDNGSTAVEVGLKMAFQYWHNKGEKKTKVIALKEAYHGDTFGAMSVGSRSAFTEPFFPFLFDVEFIESPAINAEKSISQLREIVKNNDVAAFIYEPLVQGAGGMLMYSAETLEEMLQLCKQNNVLCVADEVMTGFYRTGKMFASLYCQTSPDIMCLSKGLTGGVMAMSITACTQEIYDAFLSDNFMNKTFFHGHSFTANPIACATANASLDLLEQEKTKKSIKQINEQHQQFVVDLKATGKVENIRIQGTIMAFDIITSQATSYGNSLRDTLNRHFLDKGILLRPLGNTLYILPPYCITKSELKIVYNEILAFLK
ncbi:MAG: adenosylmethionine--8-amino-7-oxononanoate transaminase [Chitinophagales bacterium]